MDCLHLPKDVVMGAELTQLSGNSEMQVRNFKKLISCQENEICIQTGRHRIRITGAAWQWPTLHQRRLR